MILLKFYGTDKILSVSWLRSDIRIRSVGSDRILLSESDDADSFRSDSVLSEGDETSQSEQMIFDDARDALAAAAAAAASSASSAVSTTAGGTNVTNDRLGLLPAGSSNNTTGSNTQTANSTSSHLNVPRLTTRTAITG
jgi:hypothetical protein